MGRHMVGASQRLAGRQESCRDSWVCALTSKWQVGVLLWEHRGWILRMAALIKGRLSDNRPEAIAASFQTSEGEHQHAFLSSNIQHSTFHHLANQTIRQSDIRPEACGASFQTKRTQNICMLSYALTYSILLSPTSQRLADSRQRIVSNACKSLISYIWQAGLL